MAHCRISGAHLKPASAAFSLIELVVVIAIVAILATGLVPLAELANQRGQAAKDFVTRGGEVPVERVFLLAPKLEAAKGETKLPATRVDFALK